MDKIIERGMLFDFYGELLTEHQQKVYSEAVFNDLSLSELSDDYGISRQGIHDLIKRVDKQLLDYEEKLKLVQKFQNIKQEINNLEKVICEDKEVSKKAKDTLETGFKRILEEL